VYRINEEKRWRSGSNARIDVGFVETRFLPAVADGGRQDQTGSYGTQRAAYAVEGDAQSDKMISPVPNLCIHEEANESNDKAIRMKIKVSFIYMKDLAFIVIFRVEKGRFMILFL